ncbi:MAG: hypothetical protein IJT68_08845 [Lentisphaeria bacterium]|nr:hypothetical protein [Lentisphaeria bacterium]
MGKIPVLNDTQSERLKHLLSQNKIDLTKRGGSSTRLPTMPEEPETVISGSSYKGPFAVISVGTTMVEIDGSTITPSESGTVPAIMAKVSSGAIVIADNRTSKGLTQSSIAIPEDYSLYMLNYLSISTSAPYGSSAFAAISGAPPHWDNIVFTKLADNRGGVLKQVQHGEITNLGAHAKEADYASSAGYANSAGYWGHFKVCFAHLVWNDNVGDYTLASTDGSTIIRTDDPHHDWITIDSHTGAASGGLWIGNTFETIIGDGSAGEIIKGDKHIPIDADFIPLSFNIVSGAKVFIYEDLEDSSFKYLALDKAIAYSSADEIFSSCFYTELADVAVKYLYTRTSGGTSFNVYEATLKQAQYGDIIYGGSTVINSSSIYSSTIVHSSSITSDIHTSTVYSSSVYSSSIYSSTINVTSTINSSSIVALEYMGAFAVSGSTNSEQLFIASCVDAQGRATGVAGYVIDGDTWTAVPEPEPFPMIDGARVYLVGSTDGTTYEIVNVANGGTPEVEEGQFFTQIAYKSGGSVYQTQYGDVIYPSVGGGGTGDMRPPYFPLLSGDENLLHPCCTYTASADGWVKIATLSSGYCCAIYVTVNGTKYKQGLGVGNGGMAWYIYVRKNNQFYVDAPIGSTRVWFDAECTPAKYAASDDVDLYPVRTLAQSTVNLKNSAASYYNSALSAINSASAGADRAESCYTYASNAGIQAVACYNEAVQKPTYNEASATMDEGNVWSGRMSDYVDSVYQCAQAVSSGGSSAAGRSDTVSEYADSANAYYTSTSNANSVLVTLGIAGGTVYVDMASSASDEADDYRTNIDGLIASGETISANSAATVQTRYNTISAYASAVGDSRNSAWDVINEMPH